MKCIHHNDDDGLCAAAIVRFYLKDKPEEPSDFIMWRHGQELILPDKLNAGEVWYIVDLAMDDTIYTTIIKLLAADCKVVHIDHHKSGIDYYNNLTDEAKNAIKDVVKFYDTGASGCMLTFLYAQMNDGDRKNPMDIEIDLHPNHSKYAFTNKAVPEVGDIPFVVRYIDDWDNQTGVLADSVPFHYGFADEVDKSPCADVWMHLFTQERFTITPIIQRGNAYTSIYERDNKRGIAHGFETKILGNSCFATNSTSGDCRMFNEIKEKYDICCKFSYDGSIQKWIYFFVSGKDNAVDVSEVAKHFGGGGHALAAGCQTTFNIFSDECEK
jgi:oligoribonuclease NrnB/cAMP/cGMP phosphodiesterase (DHH superfamily)